MQLQDNITLLRYYSVIKKKLFNLIFIALEIQCFRFWEAGAGFFGTLILFFFHNKIVQVLMES